VHSGISLNTRLNADHQITAAGKLSIGDSETMRKENQYQENLNYLSAFPDENI
jgi:hypothetical protein